MNIRTKKFRPLLICAVLFMPCAVLAQEAPAASAPKIDPAAMAVLKKMADHIAGLPKFSVNIRAGYDAVQESGQKIEFGETRTVTLKRPDRFRAEIARSDGDQGVVVFNGKDIVAFNDTENVYATEAKPGSLDDAIAYFVKDLQMRLPLAMLYVSTLPAELDRRVTDAALVEESVAGKEILDHVAARTETVDFQVWVTRGKDPLPRRVVLTYKQADGQPQYWAELSGWNMAPDVAEAKFTFTPPKDAERIQFATQLKGPGSKAEKSEVSK